MRFNYTINIKYIFFITSIYILIFQNLLQTIIPIFQYCDEVLAIISVPILLIDIIKQSRTKDKKNNRLIVLLLLMMFIIGIIGNICFKKQNLQYILSDMLIFYKFYLILFMVEKMFDSTFINKNLKKIKFHNNLIIIIFLLLTIMNYLLTLWPAEIRYGIMTNRLFYSHATFLAGICIYLLCMSFRTNKRIISWQTIILFFILLTTLRIKALGSIAGILILAIYVDKSNKKISISKIVLVGIAILVLAFDQVNYYFFKNDGFARKELLNASFEIANDHFPIGTGFGTFGSYYSGVNYSPVYYEYNLNNIYGLQPLNYSFIADSFYPMILGQFGYLGFICYALCLVLLFKKIQRVEIASLKYEYISKLSAFVYLIICSTSESAFAGPMAIILSIILGIRDYKEIEEK